MEIKYFTEFDDKLVPYIYELSEIMEESNNSIKKVAVINIMGTLIHKKGTFFIVSLDGKVIGFGLLQNGAFDPYFTRFTYLAVKKEFRNKNLGSQITEQVIREKINLKSGCTLACDNSLLNFYNKFDFKIFMEKYSDERPNEVDLILVSDINKTKEENFGKYITIPANQEFTNWFEDKYKLSLS